MLYKIKIRSSAGSFGLLVRAAAALALAVAVAALALAVAAATTAPQAFTRRLSVVVVVVGRRRCTCSSRGTGSVFSRDAIKEHLLHIALDLIDVPSFRFDNRCTSHPLSLQPDSAWPFYASAPHSRDHVPLSHRLSLSEDFAGRFAFGLSSERVVEISSAFGNNGPDEVVVALGGPPGVVVAHPGFAGWRPARRSTGRQKRRKSMWPGRSTTARRPTGRPKSMWGQSTEAA